MSASGSASSSIPCAAATALPSSTSPETSARRSGRSQTRPCVRPVSAPIGFVDALKITFRHCGPRASATAFAGIPARVQASARRSTARAGRGSSYGPNVVSPCTSHCTCPGSRSLPAGNVVPRMTRSTCAASVSSLPSPFWTVATQPSANACAVAAIADSVCIAFVATMPKSHGGIAAALAVAFGCPTTSPAPVSRSPSRLIAATWSSLRSNAHTSTSSRHARFAAKSDPTAPHPMTQILMSSSPPSP